MLFKYSNKYSKYLNTSTLYAELLTKCGVYSITFLGFFQLSTRKTAVWITLSTSKGILHKNEPFQGCKNAILHLVSFPLPNWKLLGNFSGT